MGMVMAIVNVPQGFATSALTTASPQTGHGHDHDKQHGHGRGRAGDPSDLRACDFREGVAIATQGPDQDDEILDRAGHHGPDHNPEKPRQKPELCRQDRTQ